MFGCVEAHGDLFRRRSRFSGRTVAHSRACGVSVLFLLVSLDGALIFASSSTALGGIGHRTVPLPPPSASLR